MRDERERLVISFLPLASQTRGTLHELLASSYEDYLRCCPPPWPTRFRADWLRFDDDAFGDPGGVGRCVFLTCLRGDPIGFGSYDPRQRPERGIVGHNCIVPQFRRFGYGKQQMAEILRRLGELPCRTARVETTDHPFFVPAYRTYVSCGFRETERRPDPRSPFPSIILEAPLLTVA